MSSNSVLFAIIAGILTFISMVSLEPISPLLVTNILLGAIIGLLIDKKKS
ncbi:hypothetical protein [Sporosarcina obsidiansis]|nr:hypothetical protein [Sporosarcina obsidiansis]